MHQIHSFEGEYRFLSNFCWAWVKLDDEWYPSTEHAYQAAKTLNKEIRKEIRDLKSFGKAKRRGEQIIAKITELRPDWSDKLRIEIMTDLVSQKFSSNNPDYVKKLFDTGDAYLIEGNTWGDTFFGQVRQTHGDEWQGQNHLGKILMSVRNKLRGG